MSITRCIVQSLSDLCLKIFRVTRRPRIAFSCTVFQYTINDVVLRTKRSFLAEVVVVVVVFTLKAVPISTQYFLTSVLVQLTRTPSVVTGYLPRKGTRCEKNQKETKGHRKVNTHAIIGKEKKKNSRKIRLQTVRRRRRYVRQSR